VLGAHDSPHQSQLEVDTLQKVTFSDVQAGFLDATLRQQPGWQVQAAAVWRERAAQQSGQAKLTCPPLGALEDVLEHGFSGDRGEYFPRKTRGTKPGRNDPQNPTPHDRS